MGFDEMQGNEYTIENLIETFSKHAEEMEAIEAKQLEEFRKQYPDSDLPDRWKRPFNISKAL